MKSTRRFSTSTLSLALALCPTPRAARSPPTASARATAWRRSGFGYLAGPRYMIQPMIVSLIATAPFVSVGSQRLALAALAQSADRRAAQLSAYRARRDDVCAALTRMGLVHDRPAGAFFCLGGSEAFSRSGAEFANRLLTEQGVMVMPGDSCGPSGAGCIRISYACESDALAEALRRVGQFLVGAAPIIPMRPLPTQPSATSNEDPPARRSA